MALYPPIVASSMPAFNIADNKVRIYYTLSAYNASKKDNINSVHVSVRRQSSNVNVLKSNTEIVEKSFGLQDDIDKSLNRYYIQINKDDLISEGFQVDALYKVQLRFSSLLPSESNPISFYTNNISYFSQWSTVCIIKPIKVPFFYIDDFYTGRDPQQTDENNFYYPLAEFTGIYKQNDSSETLKHWRMRLLSETYTNENILNIQNYTLADSGIQLNSVRNYNLNDSSVVLSCSLPYELTQNTKYKLLFEIQTKNGYQNSLLYTFTFVSQGTDTLDGVLLSSINEEEGYIKLTFNSNEYYTGNLVIRRSDSKSNFLKWEDLKYFESYDIVNFTYYDFTAESGLLYRYLVQKISIRGNRGTPVYDQSRSLDTGIMAEWQHAFLVQSGENENLSDVKQLKLKYDFQISSYKTNVSESKTDTIGSKYPFIRRNGNMYYRSFPISGTITGYMDEASLFTNHSELFEGRYNNYKSFRGEIENYTTQYDYTYERKFREKVQEFLYNAKPKLYKSMQQGNIFIKLMQVSLTPKNELGRLIYTFSATAYEIDQPTISTYNNYGLISIGQFNPNMYTIKTILKQINSFDFDDNIQGNLFKAGQDIVGTDQSIAAANSIAKSIKYNQIFNNKIITNFDITWIRLTIESDPYLIIEENGVYRPYDDIDSDGSDPIDFTQPINYQLYQIESTYNNVNIYLGWLFTINGRQIIVSPPNNIYELKQTGLILKKDSQIIPAKDIAMLVDYRLDNVIEQVVFDEPKNKVFNNINGQLIGTYDQDAEIISRIKYKYKYNYEKGLDQIKRKVNSVKTILVDTQPGTIIKIKSSKMDNYQKVVVNHTGEFNFDFLSREDDDVSISQLFIIGFRALISQSTFRGTVNSFDQITFPHEGDYCVIDRVYYYFYRSHWHLAELSDNKSGEYPSLDVHSPMDALVFYFALVEEDYY